MQDKLLYVLDNFNFKNQIFQKITMKKISNKNCLVLWRILNLILDENYKTISKSNLLF